MIWLLLRWQGLSVSVSLIGIIHGVAAHIVHLILLLRELLLGSRSRRRGVKVGNWRDVVCEGRRLRYGGCTVRGGSGGVASYTLQRACIVSTVTDGRHADCTHSCTCANGGAAVVALLCNVRGIILLAKVDRVEADCFIDQTLVAPAPEHPCGDEDDKCESNDTDDTEDYS